MHGRLEGCDASYFGRNLPTLRRNLLLPFTLMTVAEGCSKTSPCFQQTVRLHIPEQENLQTFIFFLKVIQAGKYYLKSGTVMFFSGGGKGVYPCG
jgi:hypothetical protein